MLNYHNKYDEKNNGTVYAFDMFYNILKKRNISGSLVACPGKDIDRYINYAHQIKSKKWVGWFIENDPERFNDIKETVARVNLSNLNVINGSVIGYHDSPNYKNRRRKPALIEDLGLGTGAIDLLLCASVNLRRQSTLIEKGQPKVQMVDSSIRSYSCQKIIAAYQNYLSIINVKIKRINNILVSQMGNINCLGKEYSNEVIEYHDRLLGRKCKVYEHKVELEENDREAELIMYSCINGSRMLQSMLIYK